jgi:choline dehydrogenase-like flavoprotein
VGRSLSSGIVAELVDGSEITYKAKEVILAAGGPMTPQILEISGIGSRTLLESHGIPIIVDNPIVGENLQDHSLAC